MQMNNLYPTNNAAKIILMLFLVGISILVSSKPLNVQNSSINVIVIDAGHGGKDPGCLGVSSSLEKEVVLDMALLLDSLLKKKLPEVKVVLTRSSDRFIPLWQRAAIANRAKADLFISLHCNAHADKNMNGAETYVMGVHKNENNLEVSRRENAALHLEGKYKTSGHYSDFDPNSPEANIVLSLYQNAFLEHSVAVASKVQEQVKQRGKLRDLGVNQAGFVVLWKTAMPSILVEAGYLTNASNEKYLTSETGKKETASNIFEAVWAFKQELEADNR